MHTDILTSTQKIYLQISAQKGFYCNSKQFQNKAEVYSFIWEATHCIIVLQRKYVNRTTFGIIEKRGEKEIAEPVLSSWHQKQQVEKLELNKLWSLLPNLIKVA